MSAIANLGAFGLTFLDKLLSETSSRLTATQSKNVTKQAVETIHASYLAALATGSRPPTFTAADVAQRGALIRSISSTTNQPALVVTAVLMALYNLDKAGAIPHEKYDPAGFQKTEQAKKAFSTEQTWFERNVAAIGTAKKAGIVAAALLGLGLVAYLGGPAIRNVSKRATRV